MATVEKRPEFYSLPASLKSDILLSGNPHLSPSLIKLFTTTITPFIRQQTALDRQSYTIGDIQDIQLRVSYDPETMQETKSLEIFLKTTGNTSSNRSIQIFYSLKTHALFKTFQRLCQQARLTSENPEKSHSESHIVALPSKALAESPTTKKTIEYTKAAFEKFHPLKSRELTGFKKYFHKFLDFTLDWLIPVSDVWAIGRNGLNIGSDILQLTLYTLLLVPIARMIQGVIYLPQGAAWLRDGVIANDKSSNSLDTRGKLISGCDIFSGISSVVEGLLWITLGILVLAGEAVAATTITFILFNILFVISFAILIAKGLFGLAEVITFKKKIQIYLDGLEALSDEEKIQRVTDFLKDQIELSPVEIEKITQKITAKMLEKFKKDKISNSDIEQEKAINAAVDEALQKKAQRKILRFERRTSEDFVKLVKIRLFDSAKPLNVQQALALHTYAKQASNKALLKNIVYIAIGILGEVGAVISNVTVIGDIIMWMALNAIFLLFLDLGKIFNRLYKWQLSNRIRNTFHLPPEKKPLSAKQLQQEEEALESFRLLFSEPTAQANIATT